MSIDSLLIWLQLLSALLAIVFTVRNKVAKDDLPDPCNPAHRIGSDKTVIASAFIGVAMFTSFTFMLWKMDAGISTQVTEIALVVTFLAVISTFAGMAIQYRRIYKAFRSLSKNE